MALLLPKITERLSKISALNTNAHCSQAIYRATCNDRKLFRILLNYDLYRYERASARHRRHLRHLRH